MLEALKDNFQNVLLIIAAVAILLWPQFSAMVKAQLNGESGGGGKEPAPTNSLPSGCDCCCPKEEEYPQDQPKSEWVVETMQIRSYCLSHRLGEGVKLCEDLIGVLVAGKPDPIDPEVEKAVVMVKKREVR